MSGLGILVAGILFGNQASSVGLSNQNLRIAAEPWPPFLSIYCLNGGREKTFLWDWEADCPPGEEKVLDGFMLELLLFMKERRHFNFTLVHSVDGLWGGSCNGANNCSGMIGMVNRKVVDFALGTQRGGNKMCHRFCESA